MNQKTKALTAMIVLASSTAFAAGNGPQTIPSTAQAANAPAPVRPQGVAPTTPAGQSEPVCAPRRMKSGLARPAVTLPGNTAAPSATTPPGALKTPPANCRPLRRHGGPGAGRAEEQTAPGMAAAPEASGRPGRAAPGRPPVSGAARLQAELSRIDALLASTTDARARAYLTDARTQAQGGHLRAARALVRAAEAITGGQK